MKKLFQFLLLAILAVLFALLLIASDPGIVVIRNQLWQLETSFNIFILALCLILFIILLFSRLINTLINMPNNAANYRLQRSNERAYHQLLDAVKLYFEGRYGQSLKRSEILFAEGKKNLLAALLAANSAKKIGNIEKLNFWVDKARECDKSIDAVALMITADANIKQGDAATAIELLNQLQKKYGTHIASLRLQLKAEIAEENWSKVIRLLRVLEKRKALLASEAESLKFKANIELVRGMLYNGDDWCKYLLNLPKKERNPRLLQAVGRILYNKPRQGDLEALAKLIESLELDEENIYRSDLYRYYGLIDGGDLLSRINIAEKWLKKDPLDAELLVTLGILCRKQQLWGKAKSYLEESLRQENSRETHYQLAKLFDEIGETDNANMHYRAAAKLN